MTAINCELVAGSRFGSKSTQLLEIMVISECDVLVGVDKSVYWISLFVFIYILLRARDSFYFCVGKGIGHVYNFSSSFPKGFFIKQKVSLHLFSSK